MTVIYYKSRPTFSGQKIDLLRMSQIHNKFFMPYPLWKSGNISPGLDYPSDICNGTSRNRGVALDPGGGQSSVSKTAVTVTKLINEVDSTKEKKWAIIPRLETGTVWIAPIVTCYQVWSKNSKWIISSPFPTNPNPISKYIYDADIAQGWDVGTWKAVWFSQLPRWFSKQLLSRTSVGKINPLGAYPSVLPSPESVAAAAYNAPAGSCQALPVAPNPSPPEFSKILSRLVERLSPTLLEILCVELLTITTALCWQHVGGAGDGGVDGIGYHPTKPDAPPQLLQVKWQYGGTDLHHPAPKLELHFSYLIGKPPENLTVKIWGPNDIARLVAENWSCLSTFMRRTLS